MKYSWRESGAGGTLDRLARPVRDLFGQIHSAVTALLWANIIVFTLQLLFAVSRSYGMHDWFALSGVGIQQGRLWQLATYMFLHDLGIFHLLINMLLLWFFGREVEFYIGSRPFLKLYFLGGIIGGALWLAFNFHGSIPVVGASAAVLACVIAFATLFPNREITLLLFFVLPITMKAKTIALLAVAINLVPILTHQHSNVAHLAHLGGMFVGYWYIKALGYGRTPRVIVAWQSFVDGFRRKPRAPQRDEDDIDDSAEDFISKEVDPILDKIAREGLQSLTERERKVLEKAREKMAKKQS
jgi:membrane associated rhomboid family serine protease